MTQQNHCTLSIQGARIPLPTGLTTVLMVGCFLIASYAAAMTV